MQWACLVAMFRGRFISALNDSYLRHLLVAITISKMIVKKAIAA